MAHQGYYPPMRQKPAKENWIAYILWFFLGQLGIHKFYLEQTFSGLVYLGLGLVGWATSFIFIGYFLLVPLWIMLFIDIFTIPGRVRRLNNLPEHNGWH